MWWNEIQRTNFNWSLPTCLTQSSNWSRSLASARAFVWRFRSIIIVFQVFQKKIIVNYLNNNNKTELKQNYKLVRQILSIVCSSKASSANAIDNLLKTLMNRINYFELHSIIANTTATHLLTNVDFRHETTFRQQLKILVSWLTQQRFLENY